MSKVQLNGWVMQSDKFTNDSESDVELFAQICKTETPSQDKHKQKHYVMELSMHEHSDNLYSLMNMSEESDLRIGVQHAWDREMVGFMLYELGVNKELIFDCDETNLFCPNLYVCGDTKVYIKSSLDNTDACIEGCIAEPALVGPVDVMRTLTLARFSKIKTIKRTNNLMENARYAVGPARGPCYVVRPMYTGTLAVK